MRIEASAVTDAPVDDVWQWWTDYGSEGDVQSMDHGFGKTRRRIVDRHGNRVVLREEMPLPFDRSPGLVEHDVILHEEDHSITERAQRPVPYESRWFFEPVNDGRGTRVRRVIESHARTADALGRVTKPVLRSLTERDLRHHIGEFEREHRRATP